MKNSRKESIEFVRCDLCGSDDTSNHLLFDDYKYVQCKVCGLIYQNPRPVFKDLQKRYSEKYFKYEITNHHNFFKLMKKTLDDIKFVQKITPQFKEPKRFLDIGSATGLLLNYVRSYGWQVKGVELCKESAEYARKEFNLDIFNGPFEKANFRPNSFDVIHFSHLIEHVPSPLRLLKKVYKILKKGGYILVTTPRVDSFQNYLFKKEWRSYHRDHLYIFSKKTLTDIIQKANFKILKTISWGGIEKGKANVVIKTVADKIVKLLNWGDVIFVLAQK